MKVRLTAAEISVLECAGLDIEDTEPDTNADVLREAWNGNTLTVTFETERALIAALTDICNSEDEVVNGRGGDYDPEQKRQAARAGAAAERIIVKMAKAMAKEKT